MNNQVKGDKLKYCLVLTVNKEWFIYGAFLLIGDLRCMLQLPQGKLELVQVYKESTKDKKGNKDEVDKEPTVTEYYACMLLF